MARGSLDSIPRLLRGDGAPSGAGNKALLVRGRGAMPRAAVGKRGVADQCRDTALAAERVLDAAGSELHDVDGRAVAVDVLRGVSTEGRAGALRGRHHFFPEGDPVDR